MSLKIRSYLPAFIILVAIGAAILLPAIASYCFCGHLKKDMLFICFGRINIGTMTYPIIVAASYRKKLNRSLRIFLIYCIAYLVANLIEQLFIWMTIYHFDLIKPYMEYWDIWDTNFLQILYYLVSFAFLGWFYYALMPYKYGLWIKRIAFLLFISVIINYIFIEGYKVYGIFNPAAHAIFSFALPAFYLKYLYKNMLYLPIFKNSYFWISFGLIFTNLIGFFLYLIGDTLHTDYYSLFIKLSIARNGFDMIAQVLLSIGFLYAPFAKYIPLPENEDTQDQKND